MCVCVCLHSMVYLMRAIRNTKAHAHTIFSRIFSDPCGWGVGVGWLQYTTHLTPPLCTHSHRALTCTQVKCALLRARLSECECACVRVCVPMHTRACPLNMHRRNYILLPRIRPVWEGGGGGVAWGCIAGTHARNAKRTSEPVNTQRTDGAMCPLFII